MPAAENDTQKKLQEIAGSSATNCGQVTVLSGDAVKNAGDCAMDAAKSKKPFVVSYNLPGMTVGVAAGADGKLFTVQSEEENGKPAPPKVQECPSELRIAQSGRVTCIPTGAFGMTPGSANPHAGQGASPHGGAMGTPPPGTANPHQPAAPKKSH
jgi:hypothetical protein